MKVAASYIKSPVDSKKTIQLLDNSNVDYIHADLMDGKYVDAKNFTISKVVELLSKANKPIGVHLMTMNPEKYFDNLGILNVNTIYIHPSSTKNAMDILNKIKNMGISSAIVINPDEKITDFKEYFPVIDEVLIMSVVPGLGGQEFIMDTLEKLEEIKTYKEKYNFLVSVDGGINDETVKLLNNVDLVVSGSFICFSDNINKAINALKQ